MPNLPQPPANSQVRISPQKYRTFELNIPVLREKLDRAPEEHPVSAAGEGDEITLPMPDGNMARFRFVESSVMEPELAARFPEIKTYVGQGIDDPAASVRFDLSPNGFHAQILSPSGAVYIDPAFSGESKTHISYYKRDYRRAADGFTCVVPNEDEAFQSAAASSVASRSGGTLRTYRVACAATGEYTQYHGGTVSSGMAAIVTAINRVTGIYEIELAIRLVLVSNNHLIVYTNGSTDPYTNNDGSKMLNENQSNIDSIIGPSNYDIGHVFSTGGGGIAYLRSVCVSGSKARGVTGSPAPIGDPFYVDYVAHEMGHQFGGNHTFNSITGNCGGGNRNASTAYEPGSGSTIQAYAGICGSDDLQPNSDPYFHSISFDEMYTYVSTGGGSSCAVMNATGNNAPNISAGPNYSIPRSTPFTLTATGSDPNGDVLTYCWEQRDLGAATTLSDPDNGSSPIFRSFNPATSPSRTFPKLASILNNSTSLGEKLPTTTRTMNFRVTARDNRAGGGAVNTADTQVSVVATAGPFRVTAPNTNVVWSGNRTVTWDVAGTTASPINASGVNILLSTNGGLTFPIILKTNTPNDGVELVTIPNLFTSAARIKVEAVGNIFFDISDANFTVAPITISSVAISAEGCLPGNGAVDPDETVTVDVSLANIGGVNNTNVSATLLAAGGVVSPSSSQSYGMLPLNGTPVTRSFSFTGVGLCGGLLHAVFEIRDGTTIIGNLTNTFTLGQVNVQVAGGSNTTRIKVPSSGNAGNASPYPSGIVLSGLTGVVQKVTVTLSNLVHTYPDDVDVLLVGPSGQSVLLMSDAGSGININNVTLTFDDAAATPLPDSSGIVPGTFLPSNYDTTSDSFSAPAPVGSYGSSLAVFNGSNPNGTWSLYARDDATPDGGDILNGWSIAVTVAQASCCTGNNSAPSLSDLPNQVINEDGSVVLNFTVNDAETDAALLAVSASSSNTNLVPDSNLILSGGGTNRSLAITPAADQFGSSTITVAVSDGQSAVFDSFLLTVNAVNDAPVLAGIGDKIVNEGDLLIFTNVATDIDTPSGQLTFSLGINPPAGSTVHPTSGVFTWSPAEVQGPGVYNLSIVVNDNGAPNLSDTKNFNVTVNEVNAAPELTAIADRVVHAGTTVMITNVGTDADLPANTLIYALDSGAPSGSSIDPVTGLFSWNTGPLDSGTTNTIVVRVSDDGSPMLSAAHAFTVSVVPAPTLTIGRSGADLILQWDAVPGLSYELQSVSDLPPSGWSVVTNIVAGGTAGSVTNSVGTEPRFYRVFVP